eukprot:TRINITY_DN25267_c0_g1_i1.p1 TRINITY_DN25267_c0_g1~~TRINITY_DN25267_c0_g1_i1.p1  ORF type:complete len:114 (-),score=27.17 TRINITY_DN25267_c0_g1_i1:65-406(-)
MMASALSCKVRASYRGLLRAQRDLFREDYVNSRKAISHIRSQYELRRFEKDQNKILEYLQEADQAIKDLQSTVVQVEEKEGVYHVNIRPTTRKGIITNNSSSTSCCQSQKAPQ